jgi:hypothetical protein
MLSAQVSDLRKQNEIYKTKSMYRKNLKFVMAYLILVGVPIVGLAAILRAGRTLAAPVSVAGVWKVDGHANAAAFDTLPCVGRFLPGSTSLSIMQSGRNLTLSFNDGSKVTAFGSGLIDRRAIKGSLAANQYPEHEIACRSERRVMLSAIVDGESLHRSMSGTMAVDGCSSCLPVEFRAVRTSSVSQELR